MPRQIGRGRLPKFYHEKRFEFTIVNARYEAYMPVIVTTNCGTEELTRSLTPAGCSERNAQKMIDRLREMCLAVPLDGPSWRAK